MSGSQGEFHFGEALTIQERVSSRIALSVMRFCAEHKFFHADDLRQWVIAETGIAAPASADRILRDLRQRGKLNYRVLDRRASYYETLWVAGQKEAA